ncbi:MAG: rhamnulose-1-phosphate aldolase [Bacteroidales bacterium]|jgi:rhamnulose-1-phosphate aldolase|nr:rhamnulose-1-phosphate aldolase [Lentimicrobiaceae bacterium]MDG1136397.1 rhamnulose-1-phosphate aldolase [Bacteroidales bacterium]MDG1902216.1 rhamnulose-1-phosphate aldolase [Bacteroidales bacterium]MDG2080178.1 rhamnulose-1-phosphate aldolase [Bacteroidales bacterium]|tara:strand:- start:14523 stop:15287 length:765 start_codon:yes stop_codon:yes gene_type:complete
MTNLTKLYENIQEVAGLLNSRGWAESNAGNLSIRIDDFRSEGVPHESNALPEAFPHIANSTILVTGKGKRMREVSKSLKNSSVILKINSNGDSFSFLSDTDILPTSELYTHLAIHNMIAKRGTGERAVLHSHVTELIAITHFNAYCNEEILNDLLWKMHPETVVFLPKGIGLVPFEIPGTVNIARATLIALKDHPIALWEKHGVFAIEEDIQKCYDLIEIAAKAVKIFLMCKNSGIEPAGLNKKQLDELRKIKF